MLSLMIKEARMSSSSSCSSSVRQCSPGPRDTTPQTSRSAFEIAHIHQLQSFLTQRSKDAPFWTCKCGYKNALRNEYCVKLNLKTRYTCREPRPEDMVEKKWEEAQQKKKEEEAKKARLVEEKAMKLEREFYDRGFNALTSNALIYTGTLQFRSETGIGSRNGGRRCEGAAERVWQRMTEDGWSWVW
ncbi:hypothetical protein P154DRAFT_602484 [Amniculicola lignicola CBS 123094]|uniref:Uncharacterized protein n=1 Tax=Amniculicola lignicola CBS 123094 TaxID=1392246 RepID=A0A6A5WDP7_9PLEO|nr:hypothetical protein P154DRAFT_602484 [Amniculicola lignicola CBS 123094]